MDERANWELAEGLEQLAIEHDTDEMPQIAEGDSRGGAQRAGESLQGLLLRPCMGCPRDHCVYRKVYPRGD